jgi:glycosyltransferase involved in cell wall biosynthesis
MNDPFVSFIVPTYNRRRWIGECLDSINRQSYRNFEVIVVDDGSCDGTVEWLRSNPEYKFTKLHALGKNGGASLARNTGFKFSRGELLAFLDSDDLLEPEHLMTAVETFWQYPNLGLFCCDAALIGPDGEALQGGRTWHTIQGELKRYPVKSGLRSLSDIFLFSNSFPGFTLRREVFERVGCFDRHVIPVEDYELALRVAGAGHQVYYCHKPLARYRIHDSNTSGAANGVKVGREKLRCLRQAIERNPELHSLGSRARRRFSHARLELAVMEIRAGQIGAGMKSALEAFVESPAVTIEALRMGARKARRIMSRYRKWFWWIRLAWR